MGETHYRVRPDVRRLADDVVNRFGGTWNTYYDHPPGYWRDYTSVDFWGSQGRGDPVGELRGTEISAWLLGAVSGPAIEWLIYWAWIWTPGEGWQPYGGWQGYHYDHLHLTVYE